MNGFSQRFILLHQSIEPWLQTKNHDLEHGEIQQTKEDRKKLDGMYEVTRKGKSHLLL